MAVVDEKGRIGGLVNVIDLLAIVLLIILIYGIISYLNHARQQPAAELVQQQPTVQHAAVIIKLAYPELASDISIGENETSQNQTLAVVQGVNASNGNSGAYLLIDVAGELHNTTFVFKGSPLKIGQTLTIETNKHVLQGVITSWNLSYSGRTKYP